jgi:hypothetical protein
MSLFSDVFSLPVYFEFFAIFSYYLHFAKFVCLLKRLRRLKQKWQKEKSNWDQANIQQKLGLVWSNRKKISQITKDYFYLTFFLLIILCSGPNYLSGDTCIAAIKWVCMCSPLMMMRGVIMTMRSHNNDKNTRFANDEWDD